MNRNIHYIYIIALLLLMGAATPAFAQTIKGNVYGGGNLSQVEGSTTIDIKSGNINSETAGDGNIYGGGYGASAVLTGNTTINVTGGTITKDVYGGGALANVTGSTKVNIAGGTVSQDVYGGGALANVTGSTNVNLTGGTIRDSYGGGLGSNEVAALIGGDATTTLNGSVVLGNVFGCNNLNGTPQGHAFVDVKKTTAKGTETAEHPYHVAGVYGGGNLAAYVPSSDTEKAEVLIENCDNSIEDVFGGGNAAAVPETDVTVWGGLLGRVFAGGNGESAPANVTRDTHVMIHGGTIGEVYGGSNNSGDIGGTIHVDVAELKYLENDLCPINVDDLYGGGNLAASNAGQINIGKCTSIDRVFGGAHNADVNGDITLAINDGHINSVFGGNNEGGDINGAITVNIEWVNDAEASLNNVYGGGNLAPYTTPDGKEGPTVNLINGEVSENVYGGGFGEAAVVTGNPIVNLIGATVTGDIFGGGDAAPVTGNPQVNANYGSVNDIFAGGRGETAVVRGDPKAYINQASDSEGTLLALTINDVYGGGDAANVNGTAKVEMVAGTIGIWNDGVCTSGGDIYGGGNAADVTNTDVLISGGTTNRVFGGGHGNKGTGVDDPERAAANVAKDSEGNGGNAVVKVEGGTITQVFAAGNSLGAVEGQSTLTIEKKQLGDDATDDQIAALPQLKVKEAYGGGNEADGNAGTVIVGCTGGNEEYVKDVYGGARDAIVTSDITLTIKGGNIDRVFGGNNVGGNIEGAIEVNIDEEEGSCDLNLNNVYGGGNQAAYKPTTDGAFSKVNLINGTVKQNVYGGGLGKTAEVECDPQVELMGGLVQGQIFGGGDAAPVKGNPLITATSGTANDIFAGGKGATAIVTGNPRAHINQAEEKTLTINDVYGGGDAANVIGTAGVTMDKGTVNTIYGGGNAADVSNTDVIINGGNTQLVFGGGHGNKDASPATEANVTIAANVTVHGGTIGKVFAGTNSKGTNGSQTVTIQKDDELAKDELHITEVYGGGNLAEGIAGKIHVLCTGSETEGIIALYGGSNEANVTTQIDLTIEGGKIGTVYGGNNTSGSIVGDITVTIDQTSDCGTVALGDVFGGGNKANFGQNTTVNVIKGTVTGDVYGGGALANVTGNTAVNLTGGVVGGAYGGGLGQLAAAAVGTEGQPGYQPAKEAVEAIVGGNTTVTLDGSQVTGVGIFGANNVNGTPKGHVKVHVLSTTPRYGQSEGEYDVPAVYGGGNKAAYIPSEETFAAEQGYAEVLIENCGNSIEYVYGGGNAAPVPATDVKIYGADYIGNAFAGGNGAGQSTDPNAANYNPGADVGYNGHYSITGAETPTYGTGTGYLTIYGGTVLKAFGGSNTLGYIRTNTTVELAQRPDDYTGDECLLNVGEVHGGGNEAEMYCDGYVILGCTKGADAIYAGANEADIHGDLTLTITSGTYGKVFGGNNTSGNIEGSITVNIDETGCWPILIGELYGCGNKAAYSVYGYTNDGPRTKEQFDAMTDAEKKDAGLKDKDKNPAHYDDPTINIISCTRIDRIFGGGLGESATVYGSPTVNINTIKGGFAGKNAVKPPFWLDADGNRYENVDSNGEFIGHDIPNEVALIGTVYGGGNEASVYGDTHINIGTKLQDRHLENKDWDDYEDKGVSIRIVGNVYGGSRGVLGKPEAAKVTGNTIVTVGQ